MNESRFRRSIQGTTLVHHLSRHKVFIAARQVFVIYSSTSHEPGDKLSADTIDCQRWLRRVTAADGAAERLADRIVIVIVVVIEIVIVAELDGTVRD